MKGKPLTSHSPDTEISDDPASDIQARLDRLEHETRENLRLTEQRIVKAELKVEAMRAGIVDMDGLKFVDSTQVQLDDEGNIVGGMELIKQLKLAKPWLFSTPSSSSAAKPPPARPVRQKLATEMTNEEYRIAKANILKRSVL